MKKLVVFLCAVTLVFGMVGSVEALYVETVDVYDYSIGGNITWNHTYDFSEPYPIEYVTLTIVADDVDGPGNGLDGEQDAVFLNGMLLGELEMLPDYTDWNYHPGPGNPDQDLTTTVFNIDASLLDWTMPISISVETRWGVEIETSTLQVSGVPEPSTILLLGLGLIGLTALGRKKSSKK